MKPWVMSELDGFKTGQDWQWKKGGSNITYKPSKLSKHRGGLQKYIVY